MVLIGLIVGVVCILQYSLSTNLFLGNLIGESYWAEAPAGVTSLKVYERGKSTLTLSSVFGDTDRFYADYRLDQNTIWILTDGSLYELEGSYIKIVDKNYWLKTADK